MFNISFSALLSLMLLSFQSSAQDITSNSTTSDHWFEPRLLPSDGYLLPVDILSFEGIVKQDYNSIEWTTGTEEGCDYFKLVRSTDLITWEYVGKVVGSGTISWPVSYQLEDYDAPNELNYYRLYQHDFDGTAHDYGIITVDNAPQVPDLVNRTNYFGQKIPDNYTGLAIEYYADGSMRKVYLQ